MNATAKQVSRRPGAEGKRLVTALARGLEVLQCFVPGERYLTNQEVARRTGIPKPTVSRLMFTLRELGYLHYLDKERKYELGTAVLGVSFSVLARMDLRRLARPLMQALAEHTRAAVNFGVRDRLNMVYIDTYRNAATFTVHLDIGSQVPIATSSMGRAYLCAAPDRERDAIVDAIRRSNRAKWAQLRKGVEQGFRDYQEHGYCLNLGDWRREIHAIAVPLVGPPPGSTPVVFSCSGAAFEMPRHRLEQEIGPRLLGLVGNVRSALAVQ